jgi:hypothetical protein
MGLRYLEWGELVMHKDGVAAVWEGRLTGRGSTEMKMKVGGGGNGNAQKGQCYFSLHAHVEASLARKKEAER